MPEYSHLHSKSIDKLTLSVDERIIEIQKPRWIGYPSAHTILQKFDDLLKHPRVSRMPNMLLIAPTNNGKTELMLNFCQNHPPDENYRPGSIHAPVMFFEAPPVPSEADFYTSILCSLYERVPASSTGAKRERVLKVLEKIGLKVLFIDELHNILAGSSVKQQTFLNMIKFLSNRLQISIVGSGTVDLLRAVSIDAQIQNRFPPTILPRWKYDRSFRQLLRTFESVLPLKESSDLHKAELSKKIFNLSEGTIGEVSNLLNISAVFALQNGQECIDSVAIDASGYVPPSMRKREASGVV